MNDINTLRVTNAERLFLQHINKCFCKRSYRTDRQAREGSSAFTMESTNHKSPKVFTYPLNNRNKRNIRYSRSREYEERSHVCIQKMKNALAQSFDIFVQIVANGPSEELNHRMAVFDDQVRAILILSSQYLTSDTEIPDHQTEFFLFFFLLTFPLFLDCRYVQQIHQV